LASTKKLLELLVCNYLVDRCPSLIVNTSMMNCPILLKLIRSILSLKPNSTIGYKTVDLFAQTSSTNTWGTVKYPSVDNESGNGYPSPSLLPSSRTSCGLNVAYLRRKIDATDGIGSKVKRWKKFQWRDHEEEFKGVRISTSFQGHSWDMHKTKKWATPLER